MVKDKSKMRATITNKDGDIVAVFHGARAEKDAKAYRRERKGLKLKLRDLAKYVTVTVEHDPGCESPMEGGCNWTLHSFSRRHSNFKDPAALGVGDVGADGKPSVDDEDLAVKLGKGLAFFVGYHEHGNCDWSLNREGTAKGRDFDSVSIAGLLVWEHAEEDIGARNMEDRADDAESFLRVYTAWCNGEAYCYSIKDATGDHVGSCGGFIVVDESDHDCFLDAIRSELPDDAVVTVKGVRGGEHLAENLAGAFKTDEPPKQEEST